ncbi:hypothetical protein LVD15_17800 [Fulvivirga maritima]|uniref:hypothetical protein n=1 Tax=Fulvivirga maritima TaxID=2904247 RepID=UPI001F43154F|nr:hypothetical protein [Fulvivirga maritima]UII25150.1 hypothetical protein LVD15_17800 [Fulvivirga maritima]
MKCIKSLFFLLSFLSALSAVAQSDLILENSQPSIKWKQVITPGFRVIYQDGFDEQAQQVAGKLQYLRAPESESLLGDKEPKRISVILQNRNSISNGFVTLGPRRSEFQTMPPQDYNFVGNNRWLDLLSVHEFRHVVQNQHSKRGFNKVFYYVFGENTQSAMAFCAAPRWFWEGDAVAIETALTNSGRGRMPSFNREFRANTLEKKRYNYHKQHLGSYKDFIPNHYVLGYHFVGSLRKRTGDKNIWGRVTKTAFLFPFIPFTFSNSLKIQTGSFLVDNYELMMNDWENTWHEQLQGLEITDFTTINKRESEVFRNYEFPQPLEDGRVLVLKSGISEIQKFVILDAQGKEEVAYTPGIMNSSGMLSLQNGQLVWNEYRYDPRWRQKNYSVIKSLDLENGKSETITRKSRYAAAALSHKKGKIVTAMNTIEGENYLVVIDDVSGEEIKRFSDANNALYAMARWSDEDNAIVALKVKDSGKAVVKIDYNTGEETILITVDNENIGHPVLKGQYLFYNSPYSGIDNIYVKDLKSGTAYQVTSSKFGAYNPAISPDGKFIYYNDYTVNGFDVVRIPFAKDTWKPLEQVEDRSYTLPELLTEQEGNPDMLSHVPDERYPVKKYSKLGHMFNIHSWGPYATTDLTRAQLGVFSRDVLSTTDISLGYIYDVEEETGYASAGVTYQGWYPIIDLEVTRGNRSTTESYQGEDIGFKWNETTVDAGFRIPLLLTRSKFHSQLTVQNNFSLTRVSDYNQPERIYIDQQANGDLLTNETTLSYYRLLKQSTRDLYSKWGQSITINHTTSPFGGDYDAGQTALRGSFYFPGLSANHSFYLRGAYQHRKWKLDTLSNDTYILRNQIPLTRGYSHSTWEDFVSLSANYALPLWCPDIAFGPILYVKRIRTNLFYDYGYASTDLVNNQQRVQLKRDAIYQSFGADFLFDINIFRFPPELSLGFRISYAKANDYSSGGSKFELLISNISF